MRFLSRTHGRLLQLYCTHTHVELQEKRCGRYHHVGLQYMCYKIFMQRVVVTQKIRLIKVERLGITTTLFFMEHFLYANMNELSFISIHS